MLQLGWVTHQSTYSGTAPSQRTNDVRLDFPEDNGGNVPFGLDDPNSDVEIVDRLIAFLAANK